MNTKLQSFTSDRIYCAVDLAEQKPGDIDILNLGCNTFYLKDDANKVIAELKAEREWHKVSDCKPPEDTRVLVLVDVLHKIIQIDTYTRDDGFTTTRTPRFRTYGNYVTHWMPLPKGPQDET